MAEHKKPPEGEAELVAFVVDRASALVPGWEAAEVADVRISHLSGGLTNVLYLAEWTACPAGFDDFRVIVRFYGQDVDLYFDREEEMAVAQHVSRHGFGALIFGGFESHGGGRIERFLEGNTLESKDLRRPDVAAAVASEMARCHRLTDVPIGHAPLAFDNIRAWLRSALGAGVPQVVRAGEEAFEVGWLLAEVSWVEARARAFDSPAVFCHNDLNEGNVIYNEATGACHVIDYEYASYNFRGFDLANTLCESYIHNGADTADYRPVEVDHFPSRERVTAFLTAYGTPDADLDRVYGEVMWFTLASHLLWCAWGAVQSVTSSIEWCFMDYAHARAVEYKRAKAWIEANVPHPPPVEVAEPDARDD